MKRSNSILDFCLGVLMLSVVLTLTLWMVLHDLPWWLGPLSVFLTFVVLGACKPIYLQHGGLRGLVDVVLFLATVLVSLQLVWQQRWPWWWFFGLAFGIGMLASGFAHALFETRFVARVPPLAFVAPKLAQLRKAKERKPKVLHVLTLSEEWRWPPQLLATTELLSVIAFDKGQGLNANAPTRPWLVPDQAVAAARPQPGLEGLSPRPDRHETN